MRKIAIVSLLSLFCLGCHGQENANGKAGENQDIVGQPKGNWKVNREFDKDGNLIRYDSIYSWSSSDYMDKLGEMDRDSLFTSFKSKFSKHFSYFDQDSFPNFFENDSLFTKHFFRDDFFDSPMGKDFINLDLLHQRMEDMHKRFMGQYVPEPKEEVNQQL